MVGVNFKVLSNPTVAFGPEQSFLVVSHEYSREIVEYRRGFAQLYDRNGRPVNSPVQFSEQVLPFDYVGCPAFSKSLHATTHGYLFADALGGWINIMAFDFEGTQTYAAPDSVLPVTMFDHEIPGFALTAQPDGSYAYFWIASDYTYEEGELYARVSDSTHHMIADSVFLGDRWEWCEAGRTMRAMALPDSLFQLLFATSDSLWYLTIDKTGRVRQSPEFLTVAPPSEVPEDVHRTTALAVSNIVNDKLSIFMFNRYSWHDGNTSRSLNQTAVLDFGTDGTPQSSVLAAVTPSLRTHNIRRTGEGIFQMPVTHNGDVYLTTLQHLTPVDSLKLNDDVAGANQRKPSVLPKRHEQFLVIWQDEVGKKARPIDLDIPLVDPEFEPDFDTGWFFPNGSFLTFWKTSNENLVDLGYRIYSHNWEIVQERLLTQRQGDAGWVDATAAVLTDETFLALLQDSTDLRLLKVSPAQGVGADTLIATGRDPHPIKIAADGVGGYWAIWTSETSGALAVQGFDSELRAISRRLQVADVLSNKITFLADGHYAYLQRKTNSAANGIYLVLADTLIDESRRETRIASTAARDILLHPIEHRDLLLTWVDNRTIWAQSYTPDGSPLKSPVKIYESAMTDDLQAASALSGSKVFFAWSDAVTHGKGFDILGKAVPLATITHVAVDNDAQPNRFILSQNYPNPFNPSTTVRFKLPHRSTVTLTVYNTLGQQVRTLFDGISEAGEHSVTWNGRDNAGRHLPSGVYFLRIEANMKQSPFVQTTKMLLLQ